MKKMIRTLAVAACLAAGILAGVNPAEAQTKPAQKPATGSHAGAHGMKSKSSPSSSARSTHADSQSGMAVRVKDDAEFLRSAYEGGLAEIALARLAAEKASSEKVKDYAQQMIQEHTMGNQMIAAMITGNGGTDQMAGGAAGSSMGTGSGTAAGTGTGSAGGTDAGTSGSATGSGAGTGTAGSAGTAGSGSAGTAGSVGTAGTDAAGTSGMNSSTMVSAEVKARESYILSTDLKPEHKALEARLSKLSGAAFDRQYAQAMVKDHTKMVKMVEAKANETQGADQSSAAQAWAKQHLPIMQQHLKRAEKLAQSTGSSMNKK